MPGQAITRGPTSDTVAANLLRLRKARGLTTGELSDALAKIGRPILATGITSIETRRRRVDVDDLMALAVALNVSPLTLLLPDDVNHAQRITGAMALGGLVWEWARCYAPLPAADVDDGSAMAEFQLHALPEGYRQLQALVQEQAAAYERWKVEEADTDGER